jgi:hypothetical protein
VISTKVYGFASNGRTVTTPASKLNRVKKVARVVHRGRENHASRKVIRTAKWGAVIFERGRTRTFHEHIGANLL